MDFPILIEGKIWTIRIIPCDNRGHIDREGKEIWVHPNQSQRSKDITLLHEAIHAMEIGRDEEGYDEFLVEMIARSVYRFLIENNLYKSPFSNR